jgi:hypothetical protein
MRHPRLWPWVVVPAGALLVAVGASCGSTTGSNYLLGNDGGGSGDGTSSNPDGKINLGGNDSSGGEGGGHCTGLQCQSVKDDCAAKGKPPTTVTGIVYDPAGALPLYDIYVYVPNSKPDPIDPGNPACTQCEAFASGGPIIGTLSLANGSFSLAQGTGDQYGVPSGDNIPLVIQTGKWRKQIVIPHVEACGMTAIPNPATPADRLRLPASSAEGDMPLIAFTSGCDPAECFLRHMGIADSEFVAPTTPPPAAWPTVTPGTGHVHFYTANDSENGGNPASSVTGGNTPADTYAWWANSANLLKYDIVFNACECNPYDRGATSYPAMDTYLNGGGRLFTTHFYYNWFAPSPPASADLFSVAQWNPTMASGGGVETDMVDQTFPKGVAFADWLQDNGITTTMGTIDLADTRDNLNGINPAGCEASKTCLSTQWIYDPADTHPRYISWNTPVAAAADKQCGRAVFSDVHLSGTSNDAVFPGECANPDPTGEHATNEKALEFLFFDLSSCVQNDNAPPTMPPPPPPK